MTKSKNSPYGSFAQYTKLNPYNPVYDEDGEYIRNYYFDPVNQTMERQVNPLYNATLASFSKNQNKAFTNYLSLRWDVNKSLFLTGDINVRQGDGGIKCMFPRKMQVFLCRKFLKIRKVLTRHFNGNNEIGRENWY